MKIAMVTEGTYPIHPGGVSDWCDQLIRGLPDVGFEVVALSGSGLEPATYPTPPNVSAVRRVGLWAPVRDESPDESVDRAVLDAYDLLLEAVLLGGSTAASRFADAVRTLRHLATRVSLTAVLRSQAAVERVIEVARRVPSLEPTLADALTVTDVVEHFLRPLREEAPRADVVHVTANGPAMLLGLLAKWERGTPVLLSEHGVYLRERLLATRSEGATRTERAALHGFYACLTGLGYREADAVLPVSRFNARWAVQNGADPQAVHVLPNGVDPAGLPVIDEEPEAPTITFAGRIDPLKDLHTLLRAFALVCRQVPEARLRLFGGTPAGNEAYRASCEDLTAGLGLDGAVTFEGPVSPVRRAFEAGHVVVLSSISEGLPLTIIEAAMCGRATVATDVGGMAEAVGDGGIVVPARDTAAFAEACVALLTDRERRTSLGDTGRRQARERFALDRFLGDVRSLYDHHRATADARLARAARARAAPSPTAAVAVPSPRGRTQGAGGTSSVESR